MNDEIHIQRSKPNGLNCELVARADLIAMLGLELSPTEGGCSDIWTPLVSSDSTCTNLKAKTRQLRLDSALSPQGILPSHTANDFAELGLDLLASRSGRVA